MRQKYVVVCPARIVDKNELIATQERPDMDLKTNRELNHPSV
jgi:hypothetical protein